MTEMFQAGRDAGHPAQTPLRHNRHFIFRILLRVVDPDFFVGTQAKVRES